MSLRPAAPPIGSQTQFADPNAQELLQLPADTTQFDATDVNTEFTTEQYGPNYYKEYAMVARYERWSGLHQTPVGGNGETTCSKIVRVHSPYWTKVIEWTLEKMNTIPMLPGSYTANDNEILDYFTITQTVPLQGPQGALAYRISGRAVFMIKCPIGLTGPFSVGTPATSTAPSSSYDIIPAQFNDDLVKSNTVPLSATGTTATVGESMPLIG